LFGGADRTAETPQLLRFSTLPDKAAANMATARNIILNSAGEAVDFRISTPSNIVLCGCTGAGKSRAIRSALTNHAHVFKGAPFERIHYCYGVWSDEYIQLQAMLPRGVLQLHDGLPQAMVENPEAFFACNTVGGQTACVFDDLLLEIGSRKDNLVAKLWTKYGRHCNVTNFLVQHNIFETFRGSKTVSLNTGYYFLFRLARSRQQISTLSQQLFGNARFLPSVYKQCVEDRSSDSSSCPGYVLIDNTQQHPVQYQVRTGILEPLAENISFFVPTDGAKQ